MCDPNLSQSENAQYNDDLARYLHGNEITWSHETHHSNCSQDLPYELGEIMEADEARWDKYWEDQGNVHSKFPV